MKTLSQNLIKYLKIVVPFALGIYLIWFAINATSPEERKIIIDNITNANPIWLGVSLILGTLSHVSRAARWNCLLQPLGYRPKLGNNFMIIMAAYLTNLGIPRSGEVLRATALTTYEKVPFAPAFGTIVTERVIDVVMLFLIVLSTFLLQTDLISEQFHHLGFNWTKLVSLLIVGLVLAVLFFILLNKSKHPVVRKIKGFFLGILDGLTAIFKMNRKWLFLAHTFFIWFCYIAMFWVVKYAIPGTSHLGLTQLSVAFVGGAFAMAALPGGLGGYPLAVSAALGLFNVPSVAADSFGWIMWIAQTFLVVFLGAISLLLLPLLNGKEDS